ncbi:hypothetical protein F7D01_01525 [Erythrobacter sp. 3-20A1M]|uniref:SOS response-associated peptidase n=1 Tax=Erythrobacter sp. 3-20A1M TaxID=2653850 RepID=UPI001BFC2BB0|nr:SOS response-associated peptidase family protein [Erythrobacter sp. 3-20A1M]QWC55948.1 hypothetical protein F7D01_01525 [Erythrobacter sp. 3-20A1M]
MCNLYRLTKTTAEVAKWFSAIEQPAGANFAGEVFPGTPGMVVAEGALVSMNWGFPLQRTGSKGQALKPKPVNNTRADKLDGFFWRYSFAERRCLIPLTAWAEAEGPRGGKTRSWLSLPDAPLFACAGIWRDSDEWGRCYSMVMTDACGVAADCHDRMPVILSASDYAIWTAGEPEAARALCRPWEGPLTLERTDEPWAGGAAQPSLL